jgi:hypothetical protein
MEGRFAFIRFLTPRGKPDQGLPDTEPGAPDQGLPDEPDYPDQGLPPLGTRPPHPAHLPARPPWDTSVWPPSPVDPSWGVGGNPARPSHPIEFPPFIPIGPDQGLPPVAGHLPAPNPPPGTIWPPLPPSAPSGTAAIIVWIVGVGWRYMVVTIPPPTPTPTR